MFLRLRFPISTRSHPSSYFILFKRNFNSKFTNELLSKISCQPGGPSTILTELEATKVMASFGFGILPHHLHKITDNLQDLPAKVPVLSAVKGILRDKTTGQLETHKTDLKAVELRISKEQVKETVLRFQERFKDSKYNLDGLLFIEFLEYSVAFGNEFLFSGYQDPSFGPSIMLSFGGTQVEAYKKDLHITPLNIPLLYGIDSYLPMIRNSVMVKFLLGEMRGRNKVMEWDQIVELLRNFAAAMVHYSSYTPDSKFILEEAEINPVIAYKGKLVALDTRMKIRQKGDTEPVSQTTSTKPLHKISQMLQPKTLGLVGCSEKVVQLTWYEKWAKDLFQKFAKTKIAEDILAKTLRKQIFATKPPKPTTPAPTPTADAQKKSGSAIGKFLRKVLMTQQLNPCNFILDQALSRYPNVKLFPIHPRATSILGQKCFRNLTEVKNANNGKPVDLLVVGIPAVDAVKTLKEAFSIHASESVQLFSAGFSETKEGKPLEKDLAKSLAQLDADAKLRPLVNGPNTVGNWVAGSHQFNTIFADDPIALIDDPKNTSNLPPVALICQSGGFGISRLSAFAPKLNVALSIGVGNQMDLTICDFFENLLTHGPPKGTPDPVAVGLYIEGLAHPGDGLRLMKLINRARYEKGITTVVYKAGRSPAGQRAVFSHTAAMASDYSTFAKSIEHSGAVLASSLEEFNTLLATAACFGNKLQNLIKSREKPASAGICAITNGGFIKCAMADSLPPHDPSLPTKIEPSKLTEKTRKAVEDIFARHRLSAVVDIGEIIDTTPALLIPGWKDLIFSVLEDPTPLAYIVSPLITPSIVPNPYAITIIMDEVRKKYPDRCFVVGLESGPRYTKTREEIWSRGIPCFEGSDAAVKTLVTLLKAWSRP